MRAAADFERQMAMTNVAAEATSEQFTRMEALARSLGGATSFTATQVGAAMEELAKAGVGAEDILGGATKAALAMSEATGAELAASAKLSAQMISSFNVPVSELDSVVTMAVGAMAKSRFDFEDIVLGFGQAAGVAASAGVEYQDFLTALAGGADLFSSGSDAGTSFKNFLNFMPGKSDAARGTIEKLGLEFYDQAGNLKDMADIAQELQDGLAGLSDKARTEALHEIFGSDAQRTAEALRRLGRDGFRKLREEMKRTDVAAYSAARMGGFWGTVEKLGGALDDLAISIGTPFNKTLGGVIDRMMPLISAMTEWTNANPAIVSGVMSVVGSLVALRVASAAAAFAFMFLRGGVLGLAFTGLAALTAPAVATVAVLGALAAGGHAVYQRWDEIAPVARRLCAGIAGLAKRGLAAGKSFAGGLWLKAVDRVQALREALFPDKLSGGGGSDTLLGRGAGDELFGGGALERATVRAQQFGTAMSETGLAAQLMGRALPTVNRVAARTASAAASIRNLGGDVGTVFSQRFPTALGAAVNLLNRFGDTAVSALGKLRPLLAPIAEFAGPIARVVLRLNLLAQAAIFVGTHLEEMKEFAGGIGDGFATWLPTISADFDKLKGSVATAAEKIGAAFDRIMQAFESDVTWREFGEDVGYGLGFAADVVVELADALADVIGWGADVVHTLTGIGEAFYSGDFLGWLTQLGDAAVDLGEFFKLHEAFHAIGEALSQLMTDIEAFVTNNKLTQTLGAIGDAATRARDAIFGSDKDAAVAAADEAAEAAAGQPKRASVTDMMLRRRVPNGPPGAEDEMERALALAREYRDLLNSVPKGAFGFAMIPDDIAAKMEAAMSALDSITSGWSGDAQTAMNSYVEALRTGGTQANTVAEGIANQLRTALGITVTPVVQLQGADAAIAKAQALRSELSKLSQMGAGVAANSNAQVQARARGGPVARGMPYLVGEQGPELVSFGAAGRVHNARATAALLARAENFVPPPRGPLPRSGAAGGGGGNTVNVGGVHVTIRGGTNVGGDELEERFGRAVARAVSGAFSDGTV